MHEAGVAVTLAAEIRERGLDPARVRIVVSGGHADPAAFDAALRAHLDAVAPATGLSSVGIVHAPVPHLCAHCASLFRAIDCGATCPSCGGPGMALSGPELIELEWGEADEPNDGAARPSLHGDHDHDPTPDDQGPDRPLERDPRPSMSPTPWPEAVTMWRPVSSGRS